MSTYKNNTQIEISSLQTGRNVSLISESKEHGLGSEFLAEAEMQALENIVPSRIRPKLSMGRVSNTFVSIKRSNIEKGHKIISNASKDMKFTLESEKDGEFVFLDVLETNTNGTLGVGSRALWKPTATTKVITKGRASKHYSRDPLRHKKTEKLKDLCRMIEKNGYLSHLTKGTVLLCIIHKLILKLL